MPLSLPQQIYRVSLGDEPAFCQIVHHYSDRLYQFALSIVKNAEDAEEIVSDVFLNIWLLRKQLPDSSQFTFYLYRAVKNTSLNYLKKKKRKKEAAEAAYFLDAKDNAQNPEELTISQENVLHIKQAINSLPPRCRQIFILVKEDNLSYREVAELLDISPATVNVQMTIAIKKMWQALNPAHHEFRS